MTRHLVAIPGGAHTLPTGTVKHLRSSRKPTPTPTPDHPSMYDWSDESDPTIMVPLSPLEWSLIVEALRDRGRGNSLRPGAHIFTSLAESVEAKVRSSRPADLTPPHGIPRPTRG